MGGSSHPCIVLHGSEDLENIGTASELANGMCIWVDHETLFLPLAATERASESILISQLTLVDQRLPEEGDAGALFLGTEDRSISIQAELFDEPSRLPC